MSKFTVVRKTANLLVLKPKTKDVRLLDVLETLEDGYQINHIRWMDGNFWIIEYYPRGAVELTTSQWDVIKEYERTVDASDRYSPAHERMKFFACLAGVAALAVAAFH